MGGSCGKFSASFEQPQVSKVCMLSARSACLTTATTADGPCLDGPKGAARTSKDGSSQCITYAGKYTELSRLSGSFKEGNSLKLFKSKTRSRVWSIKSCFWSLLYSISVLGPGDARVLRMIHFKNRSLGWFLSYLFISQRWWVFSVPLALNKLKGPWAVPPGW